MPPVVLPKSVIRKKYLAQIFGILNIRRRKPENQHSAIRMFAIWLITGGSGRWKQLGRITGTGGTRCLIASI